MTYILALLEQIYIVLHNRTSPTYVMEAELTPNRFHGKSEGLC